MHKTMYIPKGQECRFEDLTCERIVVNGALHVSGKITTKHIRGKGFISAKDISAESITANTVEAVSVVTDRLIAARVDATRIYCVQNISVSSVIRADYVEANSISYAIADIKELNAGDAIVLTPRKRGLLRTLLASFLCSLWASLVSGGHVSEPFSGFGDAPAHNGAYPHSGGAGGTGQNLPSEASAAQRQFNEALYEAEQMLKDTEFLRLMGLYKIAKETGDVWQLVPKPEPTDRVVTQFKVA